jgi:hypothetical protein
MYINGKLLTASEKTQLHSIPFGIRAGVTERCYQNYTLYSLA